MATNPSNKTAGTSEDAAVAATEYVTETKPKLPSQNVTVDRPDPIIDQRLIDLRNAEAKAIADRLNGTTK